MNILVTSLPDLKRIHPQRPHYLLNHLSKKHNITVLSPKAWWLNELDDYFLIDSLSSIDINYLSEKKWNPVIQEIFINSTIKQLNLNLKDFDAHINFNSLISGYQIAKKGEIPAVFDICDDIVEWINMSSQIPNAIKPAGRMFGLSILNRNIKVSEVVTCSLESLKELYNIPSNKVEIIPNGVNTELFFKRDVDRVNLGLNSDDFVMGFVGYLGDWVDLYGPLKLIKRLKDQISLKLVVVGGGENLLKFQKIAKKLGIENLVIFTGEVEYLKVPEFISIMDVCLLPFDKGKVSQGALPLKLFEYMACERPVISSSLNSIKNIVKDMVWYADDFETMERLIHELSQDKDIYIDKLKMGHNFVETNYSWKNICNDFENILNRVS